MLQFTNNGSLNLGERIEVYFNRKNKKLSVRSIDQRNKSYLKIVAYADYIHLEDAVFTYCLTNDRKIYKGTYAGGIPVLPNNEHIVFHNENGFFTTNGIEAEGARYAVCFSDILLAEQIIEKGAEGNVPSYKKWVL